MVMLTGQKEYEPWYGAWVAEFDISSVGDATLKTADTSEALVLAILGLEFEGG